MENTVPTRVWRNQSKGGTGSKNVSSEDYRTLCLYLALRDKHGKNEIVGLTCAGTSSDGKWEKGDVCFTGSPSKPTQVGHCIHVHDDGTCSWILIHLSDQFSKSFAGYDKVLVPETGQKMAPGSSVNIISTSCQVSNWEVGEEYGSDWVQVTCLDPCSDGSRFSKNDNGSFVWTASTDPELPACGVIGYHSQQKPMVKTLHSLLSGLKQHLSKVNESIGSPILMVPRPQPDKPEKQFRIGGRCPEDEYEMNDSDPRGRALIISIEQFTVPYLTKREGAEYDVDALREMLRYLHYEVDVIKNLTAKEILEEIKKERHREAHLNYDSFMLFLLSHGEKDAIYGSDGYPLTYDMIKKILNNKECPFLRSKPKMIFIQACQGKTKDAGASPVVQEVTHEPIREPVTSATDSGNDVMDAPTGFPGQQNVPTMSDFLVVQATTPDYVSWRDPEEGTWFIQSLVEIFKRDAHKDDVLSMLTKVNNQVSSKETKMGKKQASTYDSSLRKKVFFFPDSCPDGAMVGRRIGQQQGHPFAAPSANMHPQDTALQPHTSVGYFSYNYNLPPSQIPGQAPVYWPYVPQGHPQAHQGFFNQPHSGYYAGIPVQGQGVPECYYNQSAQLYANPPFQQLHYTAGQYMPRPPLPIANPYQFGQPAPMPGTYPNLQTPRTDNAHQFGQSSLNQQMFTSENTHQFGQPAQMQGVNPHTQTLTKAPSSSTSSSSSSSQDTNTPTHGNIQPSSRGSLPQEMQYHARLTYLVQNQGAAAFRRFFFQKIVIPKLNKVGQYKMGNSEKQMVDTFLALPDVKQILQNLKKPHGNVLFHQQWLQLYPGNVQAEMERFDISLLFILIRNLHPTSSQINWGFNHGQSQGDVDFVIKLKRIRNNLSHDGNPKMTCADFETDWREASSAILALGGNQDDIDKIKMNHFNEEKLRELFLSTLAPEFSNLNDKLDEILKRLPIYP